MLVAGRAISACEDAWEAVRVIPPAVLTGQAAGTAAALSLSRKCSVAELPIAELQKILSKDGVMTSYRTIRG